MENTNRSHWRMFLVVAVIALLATSTAWNEQRAVPSELDAKSFARIVGEFSEPDGEFDTDNLISNEKSYLHVLPQLETAGADDGIYIGVGPDQNFSYIARLPPAVAFIIDIRRDNLLLHLLFKAIFAESTNRVEYLATLTGRPVPSDAAQWRNATIGDLADY
jgi:hypothetical protein